MARKRRDRRRGRGFPEDLEPYMGCAADADLGLDPLAVGWLQRNRPFTMGPAPGGFLEALLPFCAEPHTVCRRAGGERCPLCGQRVAPVPVEGEMMQPGTSEIRVLGDEDIFAAPTMIYHYVAEHGYRPPDQFIEAVMDGPRPGAPEHRALVRTLRG